MKLTEEELQLYELAYSLHVPLSTVLAMEYTEFLGWMEYFDRVPLGWRDDLRFYKIMRSIGTKAEPGQLFESLAKISANKSTVIEDGQISTKSLKGSVMFSKMIGAKGGDNLGELFAEI